MALDLRVSLPIQPLDNVDETNGPRNCVETVMSLKAPNWPMDAASVKVSMRAAAGSWQVHASMPPCRWCAGTTRLLFPRSLFMVEGKSPLFHKVGRSVECEVLNSPEVMQNSPFEFRGAVEFLWNQ